MLCQFTHSNMAEISLQSVRKPRCNPYRRTLGRLNHRKEISVTRTRGAAVSTGVIPLAGHTHRCLHSLPACNGYLHQSLTVWAAITSPAAGQAELEKWEGEQPCVPPAESAVATCGDVNKNHVGWTRWRENLLFAFVLLLSPCLGWHCHHQSDDHWTLIAPVPLTHGVTQFFEPGHQETGVWKEGHCCWWS